MIGLLHFFQAYYEGRRFLLWQKYVVMLHCLCVLYMWHNICLSIERWTVLVSFDFVITSCRHGVSFGKVLLWSVVWVLYLCMLCMLSWCVVRQCHIVTTCSYLVSFERATLLCWQPFLVLDVFFFQFLIFLFPCILLELSHPCVTWVIFLIFIM